MGKNRFVGLRVFVFLLLIAGLARAETIELVTYYPSASNNSFGRTHADRGTMGNPYALNNPADLPSGALWMAGPLAIGTDFSAAAPPATALHIRTGQGIRVEQGLPTGGAFNGTGYELYRGGVERMHLYYNTTQNWVELNTGATPNASLVFVNNAGQIRMFLAGATGNVGIGTAAPVNKLHIEESVNSAVKTQLLLSNSGSGNHAAGIGFQAASEYTTYGPKAGIVFERTAPFGVGDMKFFTSNNSTNASGFTAADERMRITQTGNIGIGTTAPSQRLQVAGNIRMSGTRSVLLTQGDNTTTHVGGIQFLTPNNGAVMTMTPTNQSGTPVNSTLVLGGLGNFNNNQIELAVSGNIGVGRMYTPTTTVPNNTNGNIDVNDVFIRSTGGWLSQGGFGWIKATAIYRNVRFVTGGSGPTYQTITITHHLPSALVRGTLAVPILIQYSGSGTWGADWVFTTGGPVGNTTFRMTGDVGMRNVTFGGDFLILFIDPAQTNYDGPG